MHGSVRHHTARLRGRLRSHGRLVSLTGAILLAGCSSQQQVTQPPGTPWQEVVKVAGPSAGTFSYQMNNRKYDLVRFAKASTPVVFENQRLFAVVAPDAVSGWDKCLATCVQDGEPPLVQGAGPLHAWVMAQKGKTPPADKPFGAGDAAETVAAVAILAPISPILLAGGVVGGAEYVMTGSDRQRAQEVNDAMVGCGVSYSPLISHFSKPVLEISKGSYQVRMYLATEGSFFTSLEHYYLVGSRSGRILWVSYQSPTVREHTYRYWLAHRQP
ncbi:MAG: hypothetical protein K9N23_13555 [Akkermansiaceae bacterium]|nr:hypothetical protein [Akkermansiaceae bacterium]